MLLESTEKAFVQPSSLTLVNRFNKETFIFPLPLDSDHRICNDVVLEAGGSGGGGGLEHIHPLADEIFSVINGRLKVTAAGLSWHVEPGETVVIPRGVPHHFANAHDGETRFSATFDPPQQHRRFFANFAMTTQQHPDWYSPTGKPNFLHIAYTLHHYPDHLYLAGMPVWLQKLLFALAAPIARLRGYRLEVEPDAAALRAARRR